MTDRTNQLLNRSSKAIARRTHRDGMATLEFVLGLPFLMMIMAIIYAVAYAGVNKTKVVLQARHQVWSMREDNHSHSLQNYKREKNTLPLRLVDQAANQKMPGEISGVGFSSWKTYKWLGGSKSTRSQTVLITGTWDHSEITEFNSSGPHFSVLERIAGIEGVGLIKTLDRIISFAL